MKWVRRPSYSSTWHRYFALIPRACEQVGCGHVFWLERAYRRWQGGWGGLYAVVACDGHAEYR